jgi:hypothetical protein
VSGRFLWLGLLAAIFFGCAGNKAASDKRVGYSVHFGAVEIALPAGWEPLIQPTNFYVQKRARHIGSGFAMSAGSFPLDLSLEQYAAIGAMSLAIGTNQLDYVAKQFGLSRAYIEEALTSRIGRQLTAQVSEALRTTRFELLYVGKRNFSGGKGFELHSAVTAKGSDQVIYSRQFLLEGTTRGDFVKITFAGASKEIFASKELPNAISLATLKF